MLKKITSPFFELGPKSYMYGNDVVDIALIADEAAAKYNIDVIFTSPFLVLERIVSLTKNLLIFAPYIDDINMGREGGGGKILPESVVAAGADGVQLNHSARPMTLATVCNLVGRAKRIGLLTEVVGSSIPEIRAIATLSPDVIIAEPLELIGTSTPADVDYIKTSTNAITEINKDIKVLIGAGINTGEDVYKCIYAGADASGSASGIFTSKDPEATIHEMFAAVRQAWDDRHSK